MRRCDGWVWTGAWQLLPEKASFSEAGLHGNTPGARVGRLAGDQAGVAGGRGELLEVLLVEGVLHPAVHVPVAVAAEADTEVGQAIAPPRRCRSNARGSTRSGCGRCRHRRSTPGPRGPADSPGACTG